jgi:integrase
MPDRLTQPRVDRLLRDEKSGVQLYCDEVPGLRIKVGKRSATWRLAGTVNNGRSDPITVTLGRTDALTVRQARQAARAMKLKLSQGFDPREQRRHVADIPTARAALDRYLEQRPNLSNRTVEFYQGMVRRMGRLAKVPMNTVTRQDARNLFERITRESGPYMANGVARSAKAIWTDVLRDQDLPEGNVWQRAIRTNPEKPRDWALDDASLSSMWRVLDRMENPVARAAWITLAMTGLRMKEVSCLMRDDIDWDNTVANIRAPKGGETRAFLRPLPRFLLQELAGFIGETEGLQSSWLFPARSSTGHIGNLRRSGSLPAPHALRHTWASRALDIGVEMSTVSLALNHAGSGTTTWRYVRRDRVLEPVRDASERVAEHLLSFR